MDLLNPILYELAITAIYSISHYQYNKSRNSKNVIEKLGN